jgi:hypothetical protein
LQVFDFQLLVHLFIYRFIRVSGRHRSHRGGILSARCLLVKQDALARLTVAACFQVEPDKTQAPAQQ